MFYAGFYSFFHSNWNNKIKERAREEESEAEKQIERPEKRARGKCRAKSPTHIAVYKGCSRSECCFVALGGKSPRGCIKISFENRLNCRNERSETEVLKNVCSARESHFIHCKSNQLLLSPLSGSRSRPASAVISIFASRLGLRMRDEYFTADKKYEYFRQSCLKSSEPMLAARSSDIFPKFQSQTMQSDKASGNQEEKSTRRSLNKAKLLFFCSSLKRSSLKSLTCVLCPRK